MTRTDSRPRPAPPREFRTRRAFVVVIALCVPLFVAGTWFMAGSEGWAWTTLTMALMSAAAGAALADAATSRVELRDDRLVVVRNLRRREFARADVQSATWAAGCGASIRLRDGGDVVLPDVAGGAQGLANSLRAWLNAAGRPGGSKR